MHSSRMCTGCSLTISWGVLCFQRGVPPFWWGVHPSWGDLLPGGGGGIPACTEADPPVNRMSKNITLAPTSLRLVINIIIIVTDPHPPLSVCCGPLPFN